MSDYSETQYAEAVCQHLQQEGYKTHKEVLCPRGSSERVVDIYAFTGSMDRPRDTWAVEVKRSFSLRVMEQAEFWRRHAERASVAVPAGSGRLRTFSYKVCREMGIGVLDVDFEDREEGNYVRKKKLAGKERDPWVPELVEAQKHSDAGSAGGDHWTPLDRTLDRLLAYVQQNEGTMLIEAIHEIDHHYSGDTSAFASLKKHIYGRKIPEIWMKRSGDEYRLVIRDQE